MRRKQFAVLISSFIALSTLLPTSIFAGEQKTITRKDDPVVVKFKNFPKLLGENPQKLRLYHVTGQSPQLIPFQIDEVDENGNYHFPKLKKATPVTETQIQGRLDPMDELVFLSKDLGNRAQLAGDKWTEVSIVDPVNQKHGWVYLHVEDETAPYATEHYVTYNEKDKIISGLTYHLSKDCINLDRLEVQKTDHTYTDNILDRLKVRFKVKLFLGIEFNYSEAKLRKEVIWQKAGPIRFIQILQVTPILMFGIKLPSAEAVSMFYPNYYIANVSVDLLFSPKHFCSRADFEVYFDFLKKDGPAEVYVSNLADHTLVADGKMTSEEVKATNKLPFRWYAIQLANKTTLFSIATKYPGLEKVTPSPYFKYSDDASSDDKPEMEEGCFGCSGFYVDTLPLKKGNYKFLGHFFFLSDYQKGDEVNYLNLVDHPLEAEAK